MKQWEIGTWTSGEPELLTWRDDFVEATNKEVAEALAIQKGYNPRRVELREVS